MYGTGGTLYHTDVKEDREETQGKKRMTQASGI
jgi:hypothetical protein